MKVYEVVFTQIGTCGMATIVEERKTIATFDDKEKAENFVKNYEKPNSWVNLTIMPTLVKFYNAKDILKKRKGDTNE